MPEHEYQTTRKREIADRTTHRALFFLRWSRFLLSLSLSLTHTIFLSLCMAHTFTHNQTLTHIRTGLDDQNFAQPFFSKKRALPHFSSTRVLTRTCSSFTLSPSEFSLNLILSFLVLNTIFLDVHPHSLLLDFSVGESCVEGERVCRCVRACEWERVFFQHFQQIIGALTLPYAILLTKLLWFSPVGERTKFLNPSFSFS